MEKEDKINQIFDYIPDLLFIITKNMTVIDCRGREDLLFIPRKEVLGRKLSEILPPDLGKNVFELTQITFERKNPQIFEYHLPINGKNRYYESRFIYFSEDEIAIFIRDITERKVAEIKLKESESNLKRLNEELEKMVEERTKKLRESEEQFRRIAEQSLMGIGILQDGVFKYINNIAEKILGYTAEEIMSWKPYEFASRIHPDDLDFAMDQARKKQRGEKLVTVHYSFRLIKKSGEIIWVDNYSKSIEYEGKPANFMTIIDSTEKIENERKLKESEEKFSKMFHNNTNLIAISTIKDGILIDVNDTFLNTLGFKREEVIGKKTLELNIFEDIELIYKILKSIQEKGFVKGIRIDFFTKDRKKLNGLLYGEIIQVQDKSFLITQMHDITDITQAELNLKKSEQNYREAYKRAEFYKDLLSHDFGNIFQNILGSSELALEYKANPIKVEDKIRSIIEQVVRAGKLNENIRKISDLDYKTPIIKPINVARSLENAIKFIKRSYSNKNIKIELEVPKNDLFAQANELLSDVFNNLLENSVIHNKNEIIEILVTLSPEQKDSTKNLKMEFIDNGIGIPDVIKEEIFQRGYKGDRNVRGSGLGLSLLRKILDIYNGFIYVEDKIKGDHEKGSKFVLLIPEAQG